VKRSFSRRDAFAALAAGAPVLATTPVQAQATADQELAAAERRLNAAVEEIRRFKLTPGIEPAVIFKA
jgi:hypothetical protein